MDEISFESYQASAIQSLSKCFAPWSKMPPDVWAEEVYRLPDGRRFKWSYAPYVRRMFLSMFERLTAETCFELYSRGLKSTVILLAIGYTIDQAPRRILSLWPTNSQAEKWSKDILCGELFDTTDCLNFLGSKSGKRLGGNTLLHKAFPGGLIDMFGSNAPGDMRRAKGSFLYGDEIDAIEGTVTDEGDQLAIFNKRGDEYPDTIRAFASYPGLKGHSRIHAKMEQSDGNEWMSTCVKCGGEPFTMQRSQIIYEPDKPEGAMLVCPRCREHLNDAQRYAMAHLQGFDNWKPQREFKGRRGFHGSALLWPHPFDLERTPGGALQMIAQQEIDAKNSENPKKSLRVIVNTVDALPFDPTDETEKPPEWEPLFARRESYTGVPVGGLVITGAADVQLNRIEVEWKAWGRNEESWGLGHVVIDGDVRQDGVWKLLKRELQRKFFNADEIEIPFSLFFIDGGYFSDHVYAFLSDLSKSPVEGVSGKVRAVKGVGASPHPIVTDWRSISKNLKGYHVGTWQIKGTINTRLSMEREVDGVQQKGWMHFPESYSEQYFKQLCTAIPTIDYNGSEEIRKYLNEERLRDETLDLNVYNYAAFKRRLWNLDAIERDLKDQAEAKKQKADDTQSQKVAANQGGGFIGSTTSWL